MEFIHTLHHTLKDLLVKVRPALAVLIRHRQIFFPSVIGFCFILGSLSILFGLFSRLSPAQVKAAEPVTQIFAPKKEEPKVLMVDIAGAIEKPGIYEIEEGSRLAEVIEKSGGFQKKANKAFIAQSLNLSAKVKDEQKIYIPFQGEQISHSLVSGESASTTNSSGKININSASQSEIESLKGIGPVRAEKIISSRPYANPQELLDKDVLTENQLKGIEADISF